MYKIDHPHDRSKLFYPDRKALENICVTEIGAMSPHNGYYKDITGGNFYIIQYLMSGKGVFRRQRFTAPCIFVLAPNDHLSYSIDSESEAVEQFWIKLEGKATKSFLAEAGFPIVSSLCFFTYAKKAKQIFTELTTEANYVDIDDRYFMLQGFFDLCTLHRGSMHKSNSPKDINPYVIKTVEYINSHYSQPITEKILADHLHISINYMHRLFCQDMNMTPNYYINKYRIERSRPLLVDTPLSIAHIAERVGFSSGDYFCRIFTKFMKCTPSYYRKHYKKTHNNMVISNVNGSKNNKIDWIYREDISGIMVREADIYTGHDGPMIKIGIVSDTHFNYCNNRDFEENHPTVMSSFANRKWLANGKNVEKTAKCLKYISDCDQMVVLGDILDYLTHGAIELTKKNIFEKYPNIIACVGNHDAVRKMEGTVDETDSLEERRNVLRSFWVHDIDYYSKIIDGRVMLIQMDNASREGFVESQITSLKADLSLARERGLAVLLFFHNPISINNPATTVTMPIRRNDGGVANFNSISYLIGPKSKGASLAGYELIINNADIIHAVFCGHMHSDYYTEIYAKTADGRDKKIPQYITTGTAYDQGHVMIVNIK